MPSAARLRDSTEILLPSDSLEGIVEDVDERFTVTVRREDDDVRIIGSPVEIKAASEFLALNGYTIS